MEIKDRIKAVRTTIGLYQKTFAERIAVSNAYISDLESGTKVANERILRLIMAEFNVNEKWLRTGEGEMFNGGINTYEAEALGIFKKFSPRLQKSTLKLLKDLLQISETMKDE
jgi:transcriptional regulator with XRE-family HTH domain